MDCRNKFLNAKLQNNVIFLRLQKYYEADSIVLTVVVVIV